MDNFYIDPTQIITPGETEIYRKVEQIETSLTAARAELEAMRPVIAAAREYDAVCTQIHAMTEPIPGYMLDVARRARIGLHDALVWLGASLPVAQSTTVEQGAPFDEPNCFNPDKEEPRS